MIIRRVQHLLFFRTVVAIIPELRRISRAAIFSSVKNVHHLARCDVMKSKTISPGIISGEVLMESAHRLAEKHLKVLRNAAVGVELDERPFRPACDVNPEARPNPHAVWARRICAGHVAIFNFWQQTEFAPLPVQTERPLDQ